MVDMIGKLWFDRSLGKDIPLSVCVERAAASYRRAFGKEADTCYINPATRKDPPPEVDGIRILLLDNILLHHYWVGCECNGADPLEPIGAMPEPEEVPMIEADDPRFAVCPQCRAEQLIISLACWACGYERR